jgi:hypothetical protein
LIVAAVPTAFGNARPPTASGATQRSAGSRKLSGSPSLGVETQKKVTKWVAEVTR